MVIILNFKTYLESAGENSVLCAKSAYEFAKEYKNHIVIICPQIFDLEYLIKQFPQTDNFQIWSQHIDYQHGNTETGFITLDSLESIGIKGSIINHAEHKIESIDQYTDISQNFHLCLCVSDIFELNMTFAKNPTFKPTYIAYEPPSLIGGNISVSSTNPHDIESIVEKFHGQNILVGAGVKKNEDVKTALKLGAKGILIASGYIYAQDRYRFLIDLTR
jgi:triosephosphate isomerase